MAHRNTNGPAPRVYVHSSQYTWVPARLLSQSGAEAIVDIEEFKDEKAMMSEVHPSTRRNKHRKETISLHNYKNGLLPMQNVDDAGSLRDYEDMVNLPYLHEVSTPKHRESPRVPSITVLTDPYILSGCNSL